MLQMHDGGTDVDPKKYGKKKKKNRKTKEEPKPVTGYPDHWTQEQEDFAWSPWDSDPEDGEPNAH